MPELENNLSKIIDHLKSELSTIRTGRAHASLVEDLPVEAYGQKMTLKELASITVPDPQLIVIDPWDKSVIPDIEKAVRGSKLGLSPAVDEDVIRVPVPPLSEERRQEFVKLVKERVEQTREQVRQARKEAMEEVRRQEKEKEISEDEKFRQEKEIQGQVEECNREIREMGEGKEEEILRI
jgi:ribosome recycling factor